MSPYGQKWKEERRMYHSHLGKDIVRTQYRTDVETKAHEYVLTGLEAKTNTSGEYFLSVAGLSSLLGRPSFD